MVPEFSIVIPVFNAEKTIKRCIESILAQDFKDFEILLVNDGSTDHSANILDSYARKNSCIKILHKRKGGASSARNFGLDAAKGEFIAFVDADDYVAKNWLGCIHENMLDNDLLVTNFFFCKDSSCAQNKLPEEADLQDKDHFIMFLQYNELLGYVWSKVFKNEIIHCNAIRFNTTYALKEDEDFVYRYFIHTRKFSYIYEPLYYYQAPGEKKYGTVSLFDCSLDIMRTIDSLISDPTTKKEILYKYKYIATQYLISFYRQAHFRLAWKKLLKYRAEEKAMDDSFFPENFQTKKIYFPGFLLLTHLLFIMMGLFSRLRKQQQKV